MAEAVLAIPAEAAVADAAVAALAEAALVDLPKAALAEAAMALPGRSHPGLGLIGNTSLFRPL